LYVPQASDADLEALQAQIAQHHADPRLVAVGEIGLDFFVPALSTPAMRDKQEYFYRAQLQMAAQAQLPVVLHVRRSADRLLKHLRALRPAAGWRGIAHAFNGSAVQAQTFVDLGFKLGFGGALTFERALQLRRLAQTLPLDAIVVETDAPDIPPHWLYVTAQARQSGTPQACNTPAEIPRIAQALAQLRGIELEALQAAVWRNAQSALPKLVGRR
jgi:TatD DNase family protein